MYSSLEYVDPSDLYKTKGVDKRPNHFSLLNHQSVCDFVFENINGNHVTLSDTGFKKKFIVSIQ